MAGVLDYQKNIQEFANEHKLIFEDKGECGFGRECVGLLGRNGNWVDYNPTNHETYKDIKGLCDDRFGNIPPDDAYHKHDCLAVLGRGGKAIKQLSEWVDKLRKLNVGVKRYENGAIGAQAVFSGTYGFAVYIKK